MSRARFFLGSALLAFTTTIACAAPNAPPAQIPVAAVAAPKPALDRAAVREKLAERRKLVVQRFLEYRERRVYPQNTQGPGTQHVWQDQLGNLCAAATLISLDWGVEASSNIGKENVHLKIADVKTGPVEDWILTSGLTKHELVAIQVPGSMVMQGPPVEIPEQEQEKQRLYQIYVDVERQLNGLTDENLDEATDALMKHPDLARELLGGKIASAGKYAPKTKAVAAR